MKRTLSTLLSLACMLSFFTYSAFAAESNLQSISWESVYFNQMVEELSADGTISADAKKVEMVSLYSESGAVTDGKAVQVTTETESGIRVDTVVPYTIDENGNLTNSFAYAVTRASGSDTFPATLTNATVTFTTNYDSYTAAPGWNVYRQKLFSFSWSGSGDTVVTKISGTYQTDGVLYSTDILTDASSPILDDSYRFSKSLTKTNPTEGTTYTNTVSMPSTRVVRFTAFYDHGTNFTYDINYTVNGNTRNLNASVSILSK